MSKCTCSNPHSGSGLTFLPDRQMVTGYYYPTSQIPWNAIYRNFHGQPQCCDDPLDANDMFHLLIHVDNIVRNILNEK